jgi:hypothetical protein
MIGTSVATAILILTTVSSGEGAPNAKQRDDVRKACMADVMRLCPSEAAARDRQGIRACLKTNFSKASQGCQSSLRAASTDREPQSTPNRPRASDRAAPPAPKQ